MEWVQSRWRRSKTREVFAAKDPVETSMALAWVGSTRANRYKEPPDSWAPSHTGSRLDKTENPRLSIATNVSMAQAPIQ